MEIVKRQINLVMKHHKRRGKQLGQPPTELKENMYLHGRDTQFKEECSTHSVDEISHNYNHYHLNQTYTDCCDYTLIKSCQRKDCCGIKCDRINSCKSLITRIKGSVIRKISETTLTDLPGQTTTHHQLPLHANKQVALTMRLPLLERFALQQEQVD